jgi:hypothetical protein
MRNVLSHQPPGDLDLAWDSAWLTDYPADGYEHRASVA